MFPLSSKSLSTGSEPLTYCGERMGERERGEKKRHVRKADKHSAQSDLSQESLFAPSQINLRHHTDLDLKTLEHLRLVAPDKS